MKEEIYVKGAKENNLKNIDVRVQIGSLEDYQHEEL